MVEHRENPKCTLNYMGCPCPNKQSPLLGRHGFEASLKPITITFFSSTSLSSTSVLISAKPKFLENVEVPLPSEDRVQRVGPTHSFVLGVLGAVQRHQGQGVQSRLRRPSQAPHRRRAPQDHRHLRQRSRGGLRRHCHARPEHKDHDSRKGSDARDRADVPRRRRGLAGSYSGRGAHPTLAWYQAKESRREEAVTSMLFDLHLMWEQFHGQLC